MSLLFCDSPGCHFLPFLSKFSVKTGTSWIAFYGNFQWNFHEHFQSIFLEISKVTLTIKNQPFPVILAFFRFFFNLEFHEPVRTSILPFLFFLSIFFSFFFIFPFLSFFSLLLFSSVKKLWKILPRAWVRTAAANDGARRQRKDARSAVFEIVHARPAIVKFWPCGICPAFLAGQRQARFQLRKVAIWGPRAASAIKTYIHINSKPLGYQLWRLAFVQCNYKKHGVVFLSKKQTGRPRQKKLTTKTCVFLCIQLLFAFIYWKGLRVNKTPL